MRVAITGAGGLVGSHAAIRLHARNAAARFCGDPAPFDLVLLDHATFADPAKLTDAMRGTEAVLHFAGINRAPDAEIEAGNPAIADALCEACRSVGAVPHIVYANSTHAGSDTVYGRSKARAGEILASLGGTYSNLVLPHIFGEGARPRYNNVTATLIESILNEEVPQVNPEGRVSLLHAGVAVETALAAILAGTRGELRPEPRPMSVPDLADKLMEFDRLYRANVYPALSDPFDIALFNTYRAATYPDGWPRQLKLNTDARGTLFEAVKGGSGGQSFLSTTMPGVTRGDHFHLGKVERFLVVEGEAIIRIRKALSSTVWTYRVSGSAPAVVDMPTLHTHSIENAGDKPLLTLFWTNEIFDPNNTDTYADKVLQ